MAKSIQEFNTINITGTDQVLSLTALETLQGITNVVVLHIKDFATTPVQTTLTAGVHYNYDATAGTVTLLQDSFTISSSLDKVSVLRVTSIDDPSVSFSDTSLLTDTNLNQSVRQTLFKLQEITEQNQEGYDVGSLALSGQISSNASAITALQANNSVTNDRMADNSVGTSEIIDKAVALSKIQDINTSKVLGRLSSGSGTPEEITIDTSLSASSTTNLATTNAIKNYIDSQITAKRLKFYPITGVTDATSGTSPSKFGGTSLSRTFVSESNASSFSGTLTYTKSTLTSSDSDFSPDNLVYLVCIIGSQVTSGTGTPKAEVEYTYPDGVKRDFYIHQAAIEDTTTTMKRQMLVPVNTDQVNIKFECTAKGRTTGGGSSANYASTVYINIIGAMCQG